MTDDKIFEIVVLVLAIGIFLHNAISDYGYDKLISGLKIATVSVIAVGIVVTSIVFAVKKYVNRTPEIVHLKPEKKLPEIKVIAKPKEEEFESADEYVCEEVSRSPKAPARAERKKIKIRVDADDEIDCYWFRKLNKDEVNYLLRYEYKVRRYFNPFKNKKEKFVIRTKNESDRHLIMIQMITEYLKDKVDDLRTFETVKPDITFKIGKKKIAIEVETGKVLRHNKKNLINKVNLLNQNYDHWCFVVIDRNKVAKYRRYGKVIDKRYLKNQLDKFLKTARKPLK